MLRRLCAVVLGLVLAGPVLAGQAAHCWYPLDGVIGCNADTAKNGEGFLKKGFHVSLAGPVQRYGHNILGDTPEWSRLEFLVQGTAGHGPYMTAELTLPKSRIFEDITPRLLDFTGDGQPEIMVTETHRNKGARLSIYRVDQAAGKISLLVATPYFGTKYRWYAPVGSGDFNGDGQTDVAFVDRPHLAKTLRVWSMVKGEFREIASLPAVTNHRIGDDYITSGVRNCGAGVEMVMVDAGWNNLLAVRLDDGKLTPRKMGRYLGPKSLAAALKC